MKPVILVGGAGYIGSRLQMYLKEYDVPFEVIDPNILGNHEYRGDGRDVRSVASAHFRNRDVVYLASIHRVPENLRREWTPVAAEIMHDEAIRIASVARRFVYISSMQVLSQFATGYDLYANWKSFTERRLFQLPHVNIIRPGTAYGDVENPDAPLRVHTVPNKYLVTGELPDEHYESWIAYVWDICDVILTSLKFSGGATSNIVEGMVPANRKAIQSLHRPEKVPQKWEGVPHPMNLYATYYGKEWNV